MKLTSCSVQFSRSADPLMSLEFDESAAAESAEATTVSVYKHSLLGPPRMSKTLPLPQGDANLDRFLSQLATTADRIRSVLMATVSNDNSYGQQQPTHSSCHGKGWFHWEADGQRQMRFRYRLGTPVGTPDSPPPTGQPLWEEVWTRVLSRSDFQSAIELPTADMPELQESDGEIRLLGGFLASLRKTKKRPSPAYHRVCFCCRGPLVGVGRVRFLCWLHPEEGEELELTPHRLELAAVKNYPCVFERIGSSPTDKDLYNAMNKDRASLLYVAVEAGSWSTADWLMTGPGGCGPDATDRWGDTALARCCANGGQPSSVAYLLARGADRWRQDAGGNTSLHRLAAGLAPAAAAGVDTRSAVEALVGDLGPRELAGRLAEENLTGDRPMALMSSAAGVDCLLAMVLGDPDAEVKSSHQGTDPRQQRPLNQSEAQALLRGSSGCSLAHSFAAFGRLDAAEAAVTAWLGASAWQRLLGGEDDDDPAGYTPMHAACQEGNWRNVRYLMLQQQRIGCQQSLLAPTALDLAIRSGRLSRYGQFVEFVADALPDSAAVTGLRLLDRGAEDGLSASIGRIPAAAPRVDFRLQRLALRSAATLNVGGDDHDDGSEDLRRDPLIGRLAAALERDSADCLLVGGGAPLMLMTAISWEEDTSEILARLGGGGGGDGGSFGLLDLALRQGKWRLAGDLLPARQFDLLPACLTVMLRLRRTKERRRGRWQRRRRHQGTAPGEQPPEMMDDLYQLAKRIFCAAMHRLHRGAVTADQKRLVLNYLGGRFHPTGGVGVLGPVDHGPRFHADCDGEGTRSSSSSSNSSVFDLMLLTGEADLLALPCATDYVDRLMSSPRSFCCHRCPGPGGDQSDGPAWAAKPLDLLADWWPSEAAWLRRRLPRGLTPKASMLTAFLFNLAFVCLLGFFVHEIGPGRDQSSQMSLKVILLICAVSYAAQEWQDVSSIPAGWRIRHRLGRYAAYRWNLVDIAAVTLVFVGIIWVFVLDAMGSVDSDSMSYYNVRLILAVAFVLYCLRMLSSLGYYERLGLYISITKTTILMDVVPFLIVNAFFLVSFGFLIVCMLFPGGRTYPAGQAPTTAKSSGSLSPDAYLTEMFQRPLFAHFGEFGADRLRTCGLQTPRPKPGGGDDDSGDCPHPLGNSMYSKFLLFLYLLIVSVVLINVLIAKLSLTVSREDERARVIWRGYRAQLLTEFRSATAPPLLRAGAWLVGRAVTCCRRLRRGGAAAGTTTMLTTSTTVEDGSGGGSKTASYQSTHADRWWLKPSNLHQAPGDYLEFLWLQAMQFRGVRHTFAQYKV